MAAGALPIISLAGGLLGTAATALFAKPKMPAPPKTVTRNMAAEAALQSDAMRKRLGAGANELVGRGRGEARSPGGKTLLGQ